MATESPASFLETPVPGGWDCFALGDLVDADRGISYGIVQPGKNNSTGVPIIRVNNLRNGRIETDDVLRVSRDIEAKYVRTRLRGGDVLLSLVGTLGECAVVPAELEGWNVARAVAVIPIREGIDPRWITTCLRSAPLQHLIRTWATTTVQATFNLRDVRRLPIVVPPETTREWMITVLSSLDDKIELNRRMNGLLEGMARAIFKAWFIDFEPVKAKAAGATSFPGMPQPVFDQLPDQLTETELGPIPAGWEVKPLGTVMEHPRRTTKPAEMDPETPYIGLEHMPQKSIALGAWGKVGSVTSNKHRFNRGELLFGKLRPYFHKVGIAPLGGLCSTDIVVVRPKTADWFGFVLGHISSDQFVAYTNAASTGTKMPRTNWKDMSRFVVAMPPEGVAKAFSRVVEPIAELIIASVHESCTLAEMRDTLLPKLISGELQVPQAVVAVEEGAG